MSEQIRVERIEIKIGKKAISLSPTEMKELRNMLDDLFPKPEREIVYIPNQPIVIEKPICPWPVKKYPHWEPYWCEGDNVGHRVNMTETPQWKGNSVLRLECKAN